MQVGPMFGIMSTASSTGRGDRGGSWAAPDPGARSLCSRATPAGHGSATATRSHGSPCTHVSELEVAATAAWPRCLLAASVARACHGWRSSRGSRRSELTQVEHSHRSRWCIAASSCRSSLIDPDYQMGKEGRTDPGVRRQGPHHGLVVDEIVDIVVIRIEQALRSGAHRQRDCCWGPSYSGRSHPGLHRLSFGASSGASRGCCWLMISFFLPTCRWRATTLLPWQLRRPGVRDCARLERIFHVQMLSATSRRPARRVPVATAAKNASRWQNMPICRAVVARHSDCGRAAGFSDYVAKLRRCASSHASERSALREVHMRRHEPAARQVRRHRRSRASSRAPSRWDLRHSRAAGEDAPGPGSRARWRRRKLARSCAAASSLLLICAPGCGCRRCPRASPTADCR